MAVLLGFPLVGIMYLLKPVLTIRIGVLFYKRVGHLCANTEFWLKKQTLSDTRKREFNIFLSGTPLANRQILNMIKRRIFVLESDFLVWLVEGLKKILPAAHWMWIDLTNSGSNEWDIWNNVKPQLSFTAEEHSRGQEVLKSIGIQGKFYVCFYARDKKYLQTQLNNILNDWSYHDYRDSDINSFVQAFNLFATNGLKAVRMGCYVEESIKTDNPNIIDYATKFRTDFADAYVMAHCKFFIGDTAGTFMLGALFNVPYAMVNYVPIGGCARSERDIFVPKRYWHKSKKRFLTLREIIEIGGDRWMRSEYFERAGILLIDNTVEEILEVIKELNARIDGTWVPHEGDEALQQRFREIFPPNHYMTGFRSRVGAEFLRRHKYLLD